MVTSNLSGQIANPSHTNDYKYIIHTIETKQHIYTFTVGTTTQTTGSTAGQCIKHEPGQMLGISHQSKFPHPAVWEKLLAVCYELPLKKKQGCWASSLFSPEMAQVRVVCVSHESATTWTEVELHQNGVPNPTVVQQDRKQEL